MLTIQSSPVLARPLSPALVLCLVATTLTLTRTARSSTSVSMAEDRMDRMDRTTCPLPPSSVLMGPYLPRTASSVTGGSMWTVQPQPVSTQQLREHLVRLEVMEMEDSVLLLLEEWIVLELCPTAGVQARGTLTVLLMDCVGESYWSRVLYIYHPIIFQL